MGGQPQGPWAGPHPGESAVIDPQRYAADGPRQFARYLAGSVAQVELWDASTHLPLGSAFIDCSLLARQQRKRVVACREFPIFSSAAAAFAAAGSGAAPVESVIAGGEALPVALGGGGIVGSI